MTYQLPFTAGSWSIGSPIHPDGDESRASGHNIKDEAGYHIARASSQDLPHGVDDESNKDYANARLISASPQLIGALARFLDHDDEDDIYFKLQQAQAALEMALGVDEVTPEMLSALSKNVEEEIVEFEMTLKLDNLSSNCEK